MIGNAVLFFAAAKLKKPGLVAPAAGQRRDNEKRRVRPKAGR
jgi:hypothetical protein